MKSMLEQLDNTTYVNNRNETIHEGMIVSNDGFRKGDGYERCFRITKIDKQLDRVWFQVVDAQGKDIQPWNGGIYDTRLSEDSSWGMYLI